MKTLPTDRQISDTVAQLFWGDVRKAIMYVSPTFTIKATYHNKPSSRNTREEVMFTWGAPNWEERKFIKLLKKAKEPFPVEKIQLKSWPEKKKK